MTPITLVASIGFISAAISSCVFGLYLLLTRSYRRARNPLALGGGFVVIGCTSLGSLLFVSRTCQRMGFALHSSERNLTLNIFVVTYVIGIAWACWSELRWRRSVGLNKTSH